MENAVRTTIAALATGYANAALAIIRVSGPRAVDVVQALLRPPQQLAAIPTASQRFARIYLENRVLDEVMIAVHRAPRSFTGEDTVELTCHGNPLLAATILSALYEAGASPAEPGEFTQRAFLNGKMEMTQAEAVIDLINAQSALALRAATEQLQGRLGEAVQEILDNLLNVIAHVEAHIDFPDEDIDPATLDSLARDLEAIRNKMEALLSTEFQGRVFREGLRVVIAGPPNAGKSSLLNRLLGFDRAIVSAIPGTTRDFIEESLSIRGIPIRLVDTAGIRTTTDAVEAAGIERAHRAIELADVAILVFDASLPRHTNDTLSVAAARVVEVANKSDLAVHDSWMGISGALRVSCENGDGIAELADRIAAIAMEGHSPQETLVAVNARHADALRRASGAVLQGSTALLGGIEPEFVAVDLRIALDALGEVLGRVDPDEILSRIFSTFCIGK